VLHAFNESVEDRVNKCFFFFLHIRDVSSEFMACSLALSVGADSSQRTCWRAPGWAPRFWDSSPALRSGCWRFRLWSVSTWPCGSETRSSPAPRSVSARARSASAQSEKGTFYSETPFQVPAAARWWKLSVSGGSSPPSRRWSAARPATRFLVCSSGTASRSCCRPRSSRSRCPRSCPPGRCTRRLWRIWGPASRRPSCTVWSHLTWEGKKKKNIHVESLEPQRKGGKRAIITQRPPKRYTTIHHGVCVCFLLFLWAGRDNSQNQRSWATLQMFIYKQQHNLTPSGPLQNK